MDDDAHNRSGSFFSSESTPMTPSNDLPSERPVDDSGKRTFTWAIVGGIAFGVRALMVVAAGDAHPWNIPVSIAIGFFAGYVLARLFNRAV